MNQRWLDKFQTVPERYLRINYEVEMGVRGNSMITSNQ